MPGGRESPLSVLEASCSTCHGQIKTSPREAPDCSGCEERRPACVKCEDCQEMLCADCLAAHRTVRLTRDHRISQLQVQPPVPAFCPLHDLTQRNYELELKSAEIQESINSIDHSIATLDSNEESLLQELIQVKVNCIRSIAKRQQELVDEVTQVSSQKKKALENRSSHLSRTLSQTQTAINLLRDLTTSSTSAEKMMLMKEAVSRQVTRLEQTNTSIGQSPESKLELQFRQLRGEALVRNLATVGRMVMGDLVLTRSGEQQQSRSDHFSPHRQEESDRAETVSTSRKRRRAGSAERQVREVEEEFHGWTSVEARKAKYGAKKLDLSR